MHMEFSSVTGSIVDNVRVKMIIQVPLLNVYGFKLHVDKCPGIVMQ